MTKKIWLVIERNNYGENNDSYSIDFSYHDAGIYLVIIETDKQTVIKKLIIIK